MLGTIKIRIDHLSIWGGMVQKGKNRLDGRQKKKKKRFCLHRFGAKKKKIGSKGRRKKNVRKNPHHAPS